jgi:hypothetical protein
VFAVGIRVAYPVGDEPETSTQTAHPSAIAVDAIIAIFLNSHPPYIGTNAVVVFGVLIGVTDCIYYYY